MEVRSRARIAAGVALALGASLGAAVAAARAGAAMSPSAGRTWTEAGIPGVKTAVVQGDMAKGPSHFYLKYAAGLATPRHHHSPDHYATTVSGQLVLVVDSREQALASGSYFAFTDKAVHAARCEGSQDCVMFIDARGPWDVVPEKP